MGQHHGFEPSFTSQSIHTGNQFVGLLPGKWMVARRCASAAMANAFDIWRNRCDLNTAPGTQESCLELNPVANVWIHFHRTRGRPS